jgi:3-deoxy-manno-octulosonate cytidylyltransferase (CMP-KDO synthetase)
MSTHKALIVIPARYGSSRFPGKPLEKLGPYTMLEHVYARAKHALTQAPLHDHKDNINIVVATEDARIFDFCTSKNMPCIMTDENCKTGSDRALQAAQKMQQDSAHKIDIILNLQGDNPFVSVEAISSVLGDLLSNPQHQVATPVVALSWEALALLRAHKEQTPFSGTTAVFDQNGKAYWFSKTILPAIRSEDALRAQSSMSPVFRHIGLYGYRMDVLAQFVSWPQGQYETMEGLEQLRFLENGIDIYCQKIAPHSVPPLSGIDTPQDLARANEMLEKGDITLPEGLFNT